ncbi:MAG: type II toxin-antitoxin system VapC family toxin [Planctomycetota bacterium]|nr:type II toxin-antitoxin system VapC family toxin [Planctomycetota bacterium]
MQKVIDASALLAYLNKEPGWEKMEELLTLAAEKEKYLLMTSVNWGEVYYIVAREYDYHKADEIEKLIQTLPIEVVDVDTKIAREAALLKASHKLSYADCLAAGLAKSRKAELVTGDKEFKAVENEIKIKWI